MASARLVMVFMVLTFATIYGLAAARGQTFALAVLLALFG
jgi:hypothetical protein